VLGKLESGKKTAPKGGVKQATKTEKHLSPQISPTLVLRWLRKLHFLYP
jgi:hypothetical protein